MLCREFLDHLDDEYVSAYIANPALDCFGLYQAIAKELSVLAEENGSQYNLLNLILKKYSYNDNGEIQWYLYLIFQ